ncbi:MAG: hybrid sensor histidine kinase/response regulator, partial [Verrucomicrobiales bacterium]|nr:hybrid sensor histidine kinase/response regulator [Verrucomicrobiales bacterium]
LRPVWATTISVLGAGGILFGSILGFEHGTSFPWLIAVAVQLPVAWLGSILFHFVDWYSTRKRLEAAKRIADAKIREQAALIDKAHDAIFVQDMNGRVLYMNPSAERVYGWSLDEVQKNGVMDKILGSDKGKVSEARAATVSQGEWNGELQQQNRADERIIVASRWTLIRDDAGQPHALLIINSDITEKKQLEEQFLRTQRMETIGSLAGGMAHDLNNALSPIMMGVQLLRRRSEDEESLRLLGLMESSTYRGAEMVRQILLFARGKDGDMQRLSIAPLVAEIEKIARETFPKSITVESYLPADIWPVRGNPTQLHQVLLNLCVNARDAMPQGGRLTLAADNTELSAQEAAALPEVAPGAFVSLMVSDTGTGIPAEIVAKIFQPFFTTKGEGKGTGLGLATVQRIVKNLGGFVRLESVPGQGTTFEILLPRAAETEPVATLAAIEKLPRGNSEWILVADDEQAIREVLGEGLAAYGYKVLLAANGQEALDMFRKNPAIALFITDSEMPVMDGARAVAGLRELRPDLPVIRMAAEDPEASGTSQNVILLKKPFSIEQILVAIAQRLASPLKSPSATLGKL